MIEDLNDSTNNDFFLSDEQRIDSEQTQRMQQVQEFENQKQKVEEEIQQMEGQLVILKQDQETKLLEIEKLKQEYEQLNRSLILPENEKQKYNLEIEYKQELLNKILIRNETFGILLEEQGKIENLDQQIFNKKVEKNQLTYKLQKLQEQDNQTVSEKQNIQVLKIEDHQKLIKEIHNNKIILFEQKRKNEILDCDLNSIINSLNQFKYAIEQQESKIQTLTEIKKDLLQQITKAKVEEQKQSSIISNFFTGILKAIFS